jgi:hypothetical protein
MKNEIIALLTIFMIPLFAWAQDKEIYIYDCKGIEIMDVGVDSATVSEDCDTRVRWTVFQNKITFEKYDQEEVIENHEWMILDRIGQGGRTTYYLGHSDKRTKTITIHKHCIRFMKYQDLPFDPEETTKITTYYIRNEWFYANQKSH